MRKTVDSVGRVVLSKALRDALGIELGSSVEISRYGDGLRLTRSGRTSTLVTENGVLVASSATEIDDDIVFDLIDAGRR